MTNQRMQAVTPSISEAEDADSTVFLVVPGRRHDELLGAVTGEVRARDRAAELRLAIAANVEIGIACAEATAVHQTGEVEDVDRTGSVHVVVVVHAVGSADHKLEAAVTVDVAGVEGVSEVILVTGADGHVRIVGTERARESAVVKEDEDLALVRRAAEHVAGRTHDVQGEVAVDVDDLSTP